MEITVSTVGPHGRQTDHLLDVPEGATVAELSAALTPPGEPPPPLFLGAEPLRPEQPVGGSGVLDGSVLGLGVPAPAAERALRWTPPTDDPVLVEVRHVSGPGAGRVWRLGPGSHEIGTDRGCALRLPPGRTPERGVWITVAMDGTVGYQLPRSADPEECGLRSMTPPPPVDPETGTPLTDEEEAGPLDGGPGGHSAEPAPPGPDGLPEPAPRPPAGQLPPPPDASEAWPPYADLALGDHLLRLEEPFEPDAAVWPAADGLSTEYNRPPRMAPHLDSESLRLMGPPGKLRNRGFPLLMILAPLVMGSIMISIFRSFYFLIFILFTPIMALGNWLNGRRTGRKQHAEQMRVYRVRRAWLEREIRQSTIEERRLRNETFPDPASLLLTATGPGRRLWQRRRRDPDHLSVRLGSVTRPSLKRISDYVRESNHQEVYWRLAEVPIALELAEYGVVGVTGAEEEYRSLASWSVAQCAVLHSPRDLHIVVLTEAENAATWSWVRWLPHLRSPHDPTVISLGNDPESTAHRVNELLADIKARTESASSAMRAALQRLPDVLVVMDGARRLRDVPGVIEVLTTGPMVRIFSLCLDERERLLPEECNAVLTAGGGSVTLHTSGRPEVPGIRADLVTPAWCDELARALAPLRDITVDSESGLPGEVRLLPLLDQEPPNPEGLLETWRKRPASTSFVVGAGFEGPLRLDLVRDGPHGLLGGTTGSGKSELLQTMIASLAAVNRPDELTFVLVDYKGGSAFRECAELPHTLGMITDLDGHLVERALDSLAAELRRREQVLADIGAKDHSDYRAKRARDPQLPPLPRLLIVIDEFATLVRELPGFVPGLISLAQRGRSLGLHLVLATQRPGGSVNADIKANTNLRIALRVTDRAESHDLLDAVDAVNIAATTPGRALMRRGSSAATPFQSAWVGARRPSPSAEAAAVAGAPDGPEGGPEGADEAGRSEGPRRPVRGVSVSWNQLGRPVLAPVAEEDPAEPEVPAEEPPTDLTMLTQAIRAAAEALPDYRPQPRPWLPPLERAIRLDELPEAPERPRGALPLVPYGLLDLPRFQRQELGTVDFTTFGHLYVIGTPRSGRTQVLRTVAGSAAAEISCADLHVYGIDSAGGGLAALDSLPHCGAVVARHDTDRLERLIMRLSRELTDRQQRIATQDCSDITELRSKLPRTQRPAHLLLLIDGWDSLSAQLDDYDGGRLYADLVRLLREGVATGIHVIATSERLLMGGRMAAHNDRRLIMRQSDPGDYQLAGMPRGKVPAYVPPGRGWHAPSGVETQIALLSDQGAVTAPAPDQAAGQDRKAPDQPEALRAIGRRAIERDHNVTESQRPFRIAEVPGMIAFQDAMDRLPEGLPRPMWALLGIGGDAVEPMGHDFTTGGGSFVIAGPPSSGRSTALAAMCVSLLVTGTSLVVLTPRESQLRRLAAHDLAQVITEPDPSGETVLEALREVEGRPVVVVVDDADLLVSCAADKVLRTIAMAGRDQGRGLLLAGLSDSLTSMGWIGAARRSRCGLLLGPKMIGDGDLIGARLSAEQVRTQLPPGRGWTRGTGQLATAIQVPLTVLGG